MFELLVSVHIDYFQIAVVVAGRILLVDPDLDFLLVVEGELVEVGPVAGQRLAVAADCAVAEGAEGAEVVGVGKGGGRAVGGSSSTGSTGVAFGGSPVAWVSV